MGVHDAGRLYDVRTNLRAGIKYLRWAADYLKLGVSLQDITEVPVNKIKALLASYNAGVGTVSNWLKRQGRDLTRIPYEETRHYVRVIGDKLASLVASLTW
jgi:soluble lytic murein transglycosylase-like protein